MYIVHDMALSKHVITGSGLLVLVQQAGLPLLTSLPHCCTFFLYMQHATDQSSKASSIISYSAADLKWAHGSKRKSSFLIKNGL